MVEESSGPDTQVAAARILELLAVVQLQIDAIREQTQRVLSPNGATAPHAGSDKSSTLSAVEASESYDAANGRLEATNGQADPDASDIDASETDASEPAAMSSDSEPASGQATRVRRINGRVLAPWMVVFVGIALAVAGIVTAANARSTVDDMREERDEAAVIVLDEDGDGGLNTVSPTAWRGDDPPRRMRVSSSEGELPNSLVFVPYEYGMAIEHPTTIEVWAKNFSVHSVDGNQHTPANFWVGDEYDTGGLHATAHATGNQDEDFKNTTLISETFRQKSHGDFRFVTRNPESDDFQFLSGAAGKEEEVTRITGDGKVLAADGIGAGNTEPAKELGDVTRRMEVYDAKGNSIGYIPIYDSID